MPICRYLDDQDQPQYALYSADAMCPLSSLIRDVPTQTQLFQLGPQWVSSLPKPTQGQWMARSARMLTPVAAPEKIICIGLNYRDHAIETGAEIPTEPVVFSKFNTALVADGDPIRLPKISQQVDYEAELVVVIGKTAKNVAIGNATDYVYGYTCGHDVSARDWQKGRPGGQWLLGKSFDTFAPLGPCLVSSAELADVSNLRVQMRLNGQIVQDSQTSQLIFSIPQLVSHLSKIMTLKPGDLIFTGTPPGVGAARKPPVFLKPGDVCQVEIEGIGNLCNRCEAE